MSPFNPQSGSVWRLKAFQAAELVRDFTVAFQKRYGASVAGEGAGEWMVRMAEAARRNMARALRIRSGTGVTESRCIASARAELEELLTAYRQFMRSNRLPLWDKDDMLTKEIRALAYRPDRSVLLYRDYLETPDQAVNCALSLVHQANFLLDQQMRELRYHGHERTPRRSASRYY